MRLVSDRDKNLMSVYSKDGRFIRNVGNSYRPTTADYLRNGTVMVNVRVLRTSIDSADDRLLGRARSGSTVIHGMSQAVTRAQA